MENLKSKAEAVFNHLSAKVSITTGGLYLLLAYLATDVVKLALKTFTTGSVYYGVCTLALTGLASFYYTERN
jgi:hypothetical protein